MVEWDFFLQMGKETDHESRCFPFKKEELDHVIL